MKSFDKNELMIIAKPKKFALVGNPNCGKTTLFNNLTGSTAHTGNWPGVTVDRREGEYKKCPETVTIVDLPGIYSLSPYTPEEVVSRNFILDEKPDCIINIIDATNLERNLYLTTQIMEIDVPVIIALNMIDEVKKSGDTIDAAVLEKKIGVPVVAISALKGEGTTELMDRAYEIAGQKRDGFTVLEQSKLSHLINDVAIALKGQDIENPLFHAVKLVESDELEVAAHKPLLGMIDNFKSTFQDDIFGVDFEALIADGRYKYISKNYSTALTRNSKTDKSKLTKSDKIDRVLTHRIWGIPMFLLILFAIFHLVFSENFLFIGAALGKDWVSLPGTAFEGVFGAGGINSPGAILQGLMEVLMTWITDGVASLLVNSPAWVTGLLCDGILGGLSAVLSFIPQILLLLMLFSILEDTGYMARVAFILDRILRRFGLSGRAFMPMIMGFGCSVPAMINTRTLADENERVATVRVIPFFSCGAKLPILTAISGGIVMSFGIGNADIITYSMYVVGIVTAILAVVLMKTTTMKGDAAPFIMELPNYRLPQFKSLMLLMWDKAKHFIQKAFTIILASTIIIWFVSHFSFDWKFLEDSQMNNSILAGFGKLIQPLFTPLGFGSQLNEWGWVFIVSAITGLIAKENVVATFGTLAACIGANVVGGADGIAETALMIQASGITIPALISFIAFNMITIPCMAAVATAKAEMPNTKKFKWTLVFWICTSYIVGTIIYLVGSWWWTIFIVLAVMALVVAGIIIYNTKAKIFKFKNKKDKK